MDDDLLVAAIRAGDPDGIRRLVDQETPRLFRFAFRILGNRPDAEDVVQEAFIVAVRSFATFRGDGPLGAWLMRIVVRIAYRRAGSADRTTMDIAAIEEMPADEAVDPLGATLDRESQQAVRSAVEALPEPYREVIALRYFAGLSVEDTAATVGRPVSTTKSHLRRGLQRLRWLMVAEAVA